jgi:hypothetical protein
MPRYVPSLGKTCVSCTKIYDIYHNRRALSDMYGRQKVAVVGQVLLILGPIITATAKTMNIAIGKQNPLVEHLTSAYTIQLVKCFPD